MPRVARARVNLASSAAGNGAYCAAIAGSLRTAVTWLSGVSGLLAGSPGASRSSACSSAAPRLRSRLAARGINAMARNRTSPVTGDQEAKQRMKSSLPRKLGLWSAVGVVVGITIGSGIFRTPASIARLVPNPPAIIGLWIGGGLLSLCGALSFAELGAMLPEAGGFYPWLREGWGRPVAFLFGSSELVVIRASASGVRKMPEPIVIPT